MTQRRRPGGSPEGGRFTPDTHAEAEVELEEAAPAPNPRTLPPLSRQELGSLTFPSPDADPIELADEIREQLRREMATGRHATWRDAWASIAADGWFRFRPRRCTDCRGRGWDRRTGGACRSCGGTRRATRSISVRVRPLRRPESQSTASD